ncbi:MAG TPA: 30S ribosomal protein S17 [Candidatus Fraserbacteria bacterium]|nr:30S ribosomal protein S17 [Candidatus Fraserbacteria bacterium]
MPIKERVGRVISTRREKTITVLVEQRVLHRRYRKYVRRRKKLHVHDADRQAQLGDLVRVSETRPLAKTVHWRLVEILQQRAGAAPATPAQPEEAQP